MNAKTALDLADEVGKREPEMIEMRRDFHRHPQLSM
jgi:metal-dependent amidase/aminoacylase/carboxypeptidase family protein